MKISDKQFLQLLGCAYLLEGHLKMKNEESSKIVARLIDEINNQQSEELKEVEL